MSHVAKLHSPLLSEIDRLHAKLTVKAESMLIEKG